MMKAERIMMIEFQYRVLGPCFIQKCMGSENVTNTLKKTWGNKVTDWYNCYLGRTRRCQNRLPSLTLGYLLLWNQLLSKLFRPEVLPVKSKHGYILRNDAHTRPRQYSPSDMLTRNVPNLESSLKRRKMRYQ